MNMMAPGNGTLLSADGKTTANFVDALGGEKTGEKYDVNMMMPRNGVFLDSEGNAVDIVPAIIDFLQNGGSGSGSGGTVSLKKLTITVNGQEYVYDGKTAISIPITTGGGAAAVGQPLKITIGETTYTYTGAEPVTLEIPAAVENKALSITCGGQVYTYDGTTAVSLDIPEQTANKSLNINIGGDTYSYDGTEQIDITISAAEGGTY